MTKTKITTLRSIVPGEQGFGAQGLFVGAMFFLAILAIASMLGWVDLSGDSKLSLGGGGGPVTDSPDTVELGKAATLHYSAFSGTWSGADSKTEVYPALTIEKISDDGTSTIIVDDTASNSTTQVSTGDKGKVTCTGAAYYCDPAEFDITAEIETLSPSIKAYPAVATTDLVITCYDADTSSVALTEDDNATNNADYNGGNIGGDENNEYVCQLKNTATDKVFRLGAIFTFYCGDNIQDYTLEESDWTSVKIPSGDLTKTFNLLNDSGTTTACSIKHIYVPAGQDYIEFLEWESTDKLSFVVDATASEPTENSGNYGGALFVDYGCEQDKEGKTVCGWYRPNANADADDIGINEGVIASGFNGLDVGYTIEFQ